MNNKARVISVLLSLFMVCVVSACTSPVKDSGVPFSDVSRPSAGGIVEDDLSNVDYFAAIDSLGYLLDSDTWSSPDKILPNNLVKWYLFTVQEQGSFSLEALTEKYSAEGKTGLFIPAAEFETAILKQFGLDAATLRENADVFEAETEMYMFKDELSQFIKLNTDVLSVTIGNTEDTIFFNIVTADSSQSRALTILKNGAKTIAYVDPNATQKSELATESEEYYNSETESPFSSDAEVTVSAASSPPEPVSRSETEPRA